MVQKQLKSDKALFFTILKRHFFLIFSNFVLNFWYNSINIPKYHKVGLQTPITRCIWLEGLIRRRGCVLWLRFLMILSKGNKINSLHNNMCCATSHKVYLTLFFTLWKRQFFARKCKKVLTQGLKSSITVSEGVSYSYFFLY